MTPPRHQPCRGMARWPLADQTILAQLAIQRHAGAAQFLCRFALVALAGYQGGEQLFALVPGQSGGYLSPAPERRWQVLEGNLPPWRVNKGRFQRVLQFAHVAGPGIV